MENTASNHMSLNRLELRLLGFFFLVSVLAFLVAGLILVNYAQKFAPQVSELLGLNIKLNKQMMVSIDDTFPVMAKFENDFAIGLKTEIPLRVPISTVLKVPIDETFSVPFKDSFTVTLDKPLAIKGNVRVKTNIPLDTKIEVMIAGVKHRLPIKASIPIDMEFPLRESFEVESDLSLRMKEPMPVHIKQTLEAPVNFVVEGVMPLDKQILAPVSADLACSIRMKHDMPLLMDLDLSLDDLGRGIIPTMRPATPTDAGMFGEGGFFRDIWQRLNGEPPPVKAPKAGIICPVGKPGC
ncbi:MAG: hypothetical protein HZB23_02950 [Deltaproteobacteria bacterium]|nr:hypothetical protein [Deltaproteobacteria bacterium]